LQTGTENKMQDPISELIERFLVALGLTLNRMSEEETGMVSMLFLFLMIAAATTRVLQHVYLPR
jgi:hypothetical protein